MAKVIGHDEKVFKRFTCKECGAIVEFAPIEAKETGSKDEGVPIKGLNCPQCQTFHRTNP